ncbi:conjugative transfer system coupling protein TraD [Geoalkalibacter subterraneus]|uniref:conjugative transfer system coupling protein TraD n=1 Tax=Geoalkalibacter subterraneus TaxID=483547 RepID=UPI000693A399|nr:conjugative transfer system coupling protein TraD [Geoalkalibacter subterraneus]
MKTFEIPYRPNIEKWAFVSWALCLAVMFFVVRKTDMPMVPFVVMASVCSLMTLWRGAQSLRQHSRLARLKKGVMEFLTWNKFLKKISLKEGTWMGSGFSWGQTEIERATELLKKDPQRVLGKRALKYGAQWIHGLGDEDKPLLFPLGLQNGHTLIAGTTGAGKTQLFGLAVTQAVMRNEPVIIFDPKGDHALREKARMACVQAGQPERFMVFHPAYPENSVRIDPLRNWNRPTEIASRLAALMSAESSNDPFVAFGWMAMNNIVNGLLAIDERPNLVKIRRYVEGEPGPLVVRALRSYFDKNVEDWSEKIQPYLNRFKGKGNEVDAYIQFYNNVIKPVLPSTEMDGLINAYTHNREHMQKMLASLIPILSMLTGGTLGDLLSPEPSADDDRIITDMSKIIHNNKVVYVGLDSLSDGTVGSAIGSILLADLTAVAGDIYNYGEGKISMVNIFVDEAAEIINKPTIQLLNKGRGAGFRLWVATQTLADFEVRTGSEAAARQALGNLNNLITLRVLDGETQKYIAENLPKTVVRSIEQQYRSGTTTNSPSDFSGMYGESLKEEEADLIPPALLGLLPNLHYFMKLSDGKIVKGKLPILQLEEEGQNKKRKGK